MRPQREKREDASGGSKHPRARERMRWGAGKSEEQALAGALVGSKVIAATWARDWGRWAAPWDRHTSPPEPRASALAPIRLNRYCLVPSATRAIQGTGGK